MKKAHLIQCCRANDPRCPICFHRHPHEYDRNYDKYDRNCGEWMDCEDGKGNSLFKVRCVRIKEKSSS